MAGIDSEMEDRSMAGMEVPIIGSDTVKWIEISVPSSSSPASISTATATDSSPQHTFAPLTEDASSCHIIGDPSTYLIWRIHKNLPNVLELMEFSACNEFPKIGLRLIFRDALCPFAFICKNEAQSTVASPYLLYTLTVSGVAFLLKLQSVLYYASCSMFPQIQLTELNLQAHSQSESITSVAATMGCLVIGRHDGSICCFQLGSLDQTARGFMYELRDDAGIGHLWGLMSRARTIGPVQGLVISELLGRKLLFVIYGDENLRVWDLPNHTRVFNHTIVKPESTGIIVSRFWLGDANPDTSLISLAILYRNTMALDEDFIVIYSLRFSLGVNIILVLEPKRVRIPLKEGGIVDLKIACNRLWILKKNVLLLFDGLHNNANVWKRQAYCMQQAFISAHLFQDSVRSLEGLIWASNSLFSSVKDQVVPFVSSIFLRRLLHPGVYQNVTFRTTVQDYNKNWTDSEFQSLSIDDLKREILSLIESEGIAENPISLIYSWKNFCTRYFRYWCKINRPYGLLVDTSTGAIGLINHNSLSLFRCLEDIELLRYGSVDHVGVLVGFGLNLIDGDLDRQILFEILSCINTINQQLGTAASAIFYESFVSEPMISSEDVVPCFLKILETGYSSAAAAVHVTQLGADTAWMKELADHKKQREFSIEMLLSLHSLCDKAGSWSRVLNVIENFLKFLVPRKSIQRLDLESSCNINTSLLVYSTFQIAREMSESAFDILLLLGYLVNMSGQVYMMQDDISRIQLEFIPMIQEILMEWFILLFLGTTPSRSPSMEDFSSQLSSLHIDNNADKRSWNDEKLGTSDFTLAFLLFLNFQSSSEDQVDLSSKSFSRPKNFINSVRNFISWITWGRTGEESSAFFSHSTELAMILLKHGQYEAVENLFAIIDTHSRKEKTSQSIQSADGDWCTHLHLLGFGLLARAHFELHGISKEKKVREAVRCFFRASSGSGASQALQSLSFQGLPHPDHSDCASTAAWKLHYYQWAMQTFEQYNMSEGACQFALAALEQVDEVLGSKDDKSGGDSLSEPATTIRGSLWANVFKFKLDLNHYNDAYCAIISNPDEDSKHICLRRFIIVLCERGAVKTLCDGQLPFVGLMDKVEKELVWKAERSDITAKPNPYKLLYAFEMHRHNWRMAASYIYRYSSRLRSELALKEQHQLSMALQESINGLSATINALHLVHPTYAWIDPQFDGSSCMDERYPNKKARTVNEGNYMCNSNALSSRVQYCIDIEKLENEFVMTSAQYLLTTANIKLKFTGNKTLPSDLVDLLVQGNFYDMAFTILLKFWKASGLERELGRVFVALSLKCFPNMGNDFRTQGLMLTSSEDEAFFHSPIDKSPTVHQSKGDSQWETLELYLEKYKKLHPRLPVIVAETLLHTDPQIELPLWLVDMFKGGRKATGWGMTGQESDPASLLRLYVDYGRFTEATNLLLESLEYIQSSSSLRPLDIINRKKMSAVWFPYTTIERLWCQLDELRSSGHMIDQCDKLQKLLHGALLNHLKQMKVDSDDAISSAQRNEDLNDGVSAARG